jgi:hypothetical protein
MSTRYVLNEWYSRVCRFIERTWTNGKMQQEYILIEKWCSMLNINDIVDISKRSRTNGS